MAPDGASSSNYTKGSTSGIGSILRSNSSQAYWGTVSASDLGAVQKSGDTMTGALTVKGLKGTSNVDYGTTLPSSPAEGQMFFQISDPWYELPAGGNTGQVLIKKTNTNYDVEWGTVAAASNSLNFDQIYPIGSIYMNINLVDPGQLFGGTWVRIQDKFLLAVGTTYPGNSSGGSATLTDVPHHRHSIPALSGTTQGGGGHGHVGYWRLTGQMGSNQNYIVGSNASGNPQETGDWIAKPVGDHTHGFSTSSSNTGYTGTENGVSILPPYITVYIWQRTA